MNVYKKYDKNLNSEWKEIFSLQIEKTGRAYFAGITAGNAQKEGGFIFTGPLTLKIEARLKDGRAKTIESAKAFFEENAESIFAEFGSAYKTWQESKGIEALKTFQAKFKAYF